MHQLYYARLLRGDFAELFMEGGPLRWLVDYVKEHPDLDFQVRRNKLQLLFAL